MLSAKLTRFSALLLAALASGFHSEGSDLLLDEGHFDLALNFLPGDGWQRYIYSYASGHQLAPMTSIFRVKEEAETVVPDDPAFSLLGNPGTTIWVIPESYDPEIVYLGIGAPLLGRDIFSGGLSNRGQVTMRLIEVRGSGPAAGGTLTMWQSGFPPRIHFSTADGIGPEDALNAITANFHAHYNWAFTQPGLYRVTFEFSGTLVPALGGEYTSTEVTYSFEIGETVDPSALRYAWPLGDGWSWSSWMGTVFTSNDPWIWLEAMGWVFMPPADPDHIQLWTFQHGWAWTNQSIFPRLWTFTEGKWGLLQSTIQ